MGTNKTEKTRRPQEQLHKTTQYGEALGSRNTTQTRQDGAADLNIAQKMRRQKYHSTCAEKEIAQKTSQGKHGRNYTPGLKRQI